MMKENPQDNPVIEKETDVQQALEQGITEEEFERIVKLLGRKPNFTELGIFALMWSEHCSYKSSKALLKRFPTTGRRIIQGPGENAGVVDIGGGFAAVFKIESHNHPSFIEPYQGAATGVGGILRDVFTMGARPVASLNSLRFGAVDHPRTPHLLSGVVAGIGGYGNCMGIPTVGGEVYFHPSYNGNILVNAFTLGLASIDKIFRGKAEGVENPVFYVGAKTGRDGIHGAGLLASAAFDESSEEKRPTVQVADPFMEKLLLEACLELMESDCLVGIQDMGAAGLSSSSFEMSSRGGCGMALDLDKVPCREEGMTAYELMLSESQERMLLVAKKGSEENVKSIFKKWDLDAVKIGEVTADGIMRIKKDGRQVAHLPVDIVIEKAPVYNRPTKEPPYIKEITELDLSSLPVPEDYNRVLVQLLNSPSLASKRWVYRQYDHMIGTNTIVFPGSDASVIRIKGQPQGLALTVDGNSRFCYLHPLRGGMIAVAEAARNLVCAGAQPLALSDCLNFGSPEDPHIMWQFSQVIDGMSQACRALQTPVVSGNVSFYNQTEDKSIHPTPVVAMVGLLEDYREHCSQYFKEPGDVILLLGESHEELGGSEYLALIHQLERGIPPLLDLAREISVQSTCLETIKKGFIKSAHDCSEGGLAFALAESCFNPLKLLGIDISLQSEIRADALLYGESQSRIILSAAEHAVKHIEEIAHHYNAPLSVIGKVKESGFSISVNGKKLIAMEHRDIFNIWDKALEQRLGL
jgi:phosphoribosylformylglycinamidine synthase II